MSILVSGIRLPLESEEEEALKKAMDRVSVSKDSVLSASVYRRSVDARHGKITKVYSVLLDIPGLEDAVLSETGGTDVRRKAEPFRAAPTGTKTLSAPPVIVGFGPAGIFAGLVLSKNGYRPVILEKGPELKSRDRSVAAFFDGGPLDEDANVQFGEGGAGAYSDGKLTTRISDERCEYVLAELFGHGAPPEILRNAKPHIGTDLLKNVIKSIRQEILTFGGEIRFHSEVRDFLINRSKLFAVKTDDETIPCETAVLAIGHSARPTFVRLMNAGVLLMQKSFAVGVRIEHRQEAVDRAMYGKYAGHPMLPPAEYALTSRQNGRPCYTFCMCPGGSVVAAASEGDSVVVNGMSMHKRNGENANSAVVVAVSPEDFPSEDPMAGVAFQREIERTAFKLCGGDYKAPCQLVGDFLRGVAPIRFGSVAPTYPRGVTLCDLSAVFPGFVVDALRPSLIEFDHKLKGFASEDSLLTAPETRTSSPVRIVRQPETLECVSVSGLIPCGEGAGYAGGIMSAAVDGIRAAERIMAEYKPIISV